MANVKTKKIIAADGTVIATVSAHADMNGISIETIGTFYSFNEITQLAGSIVELRDWLATVNTEYAGAKQGRTVLLSTEIGRNSIEQYPSI